MFDYAYAAHTDSCVFLLDREGNCHEIMPVLLADGSAMPRARSADRCVGAQYVASLDAQSEGGMSDLPKVGATMLFARVEAGGRIALIRTSPLLRFEKRAPASTRPRPPVSVPPAPESMPFSLVPPPVASGTSLPRFQDPGASYPPPDRSAAHKIGSRRQEAPTARSDRPDLRAATIPPPAPSTTPNRLPSLLPPPPPPARFAGSRPRGAYQAAQAPEGRLGRTAPRAW